MCNGVRPCASVTRAALTTTQSEIHPVVVMVPMVPTEGLVVDGAITIALCVYADLIASCTTLTTIGVGRYKHRACKHSQTDDRDACWTCNHVTRNAGEDVEDCVNTVTMSSNRRSRASRKKEHVDGFFVVVSVTFVVVEPRFDDFV